VTLSWSITRFLTGFAPARFYLVQSGWRALVAARTLGEFLMEWNRILDPSILGLLIPVVALLVGGAIAITKMITKHQERLAMIERGINPDAPNHP
jgi:hypothetical protein